MSVWLTLCGCAGAAADEPRSAPPNVLLVLLDDLGWRDLGCYGNERIETPRLDRLAGEGLLFTDAYAAAPVCSPTRASILTGSSPARLQITNHLPDRASFAPEDAEWIAAVTRDRLEPESGALAAELRDVGYSTAFFGKWHLSGPGGREGLGDLSCYPEARGFDLNLGGCSLGGPPTFFDPYRIHNLPPRREGEYLEDRLADETIAFLEREREGPFFVALWNYAVHWPMEAPAELVAKYESRRGPGLKDPRYAAMIEATDAALGRIFDALERLELTDDTLVVVTSDNGPFLGVSDVRPLREGKGYLYEGGIRVPMMVRWPGVVEAGRVDDTPVLSTDLYSTILAAAGVVDEAAASADGESLVPLLRTGAGLQRDALFFHYPNYAFHGGNRLGGAVRVGDWKLLEWYDGEPDAVELYHLGRDLSEAHDLASMERERAATMLARLRAWRVECQAVMPTRKTSP